jgi:ectoine hydroxylase-related dioxygenase (phytanoyl-CoA dioxygenase family)
VDYERDREGWTMIGFIFMIDEFRRDNGATRFLPGSHNWSTVPDESIHDPRADDENQIVACGPAGSLIVFNGSVWHGHTANSSDEPRRSIQGAYIRREAPSGENLAERMCPDTLARIGPLAKYVLAVGAIKVNAASNARHAAERANNGSHEFQSSPRAR